MVTTAEQSTVKPASLGNIERLFGEFKVLYGARLADLWADVSPDIVCRKWAEALSGFTVGEVRAGLEACRAKPWPPTLPEFLMMCRPKPDYEVAFAQAQECVGKRFRNEAVEWPNKAVYWASVEYGHFQLRTDGWATSKNKWTRILVEKLQTMESLPEIPDFMPALPAPGKSTTSAEDARKKLSEIVGILKAGKEVAA